MSEKLIFQKELPKLPKLQISKSNCTKIAKCENAKLHCAVCTPAIFSALNALLIEAKNRYESRLQSGVILGQNGRKWRTEKAI